jgi:uncharacterized protein
MRPPWSSQQWPKRPISAKPERNFFYVNTSRRFMYIHLTIAQLTVFWPLVVGAGLSVGFLSGLFGVGGGFLISPLLMFIGIPPEIAISTGANQSVATSASAAVSQWRLGNVDLVF